MCERVLVAQLCLTLLTPSPIVCQVPLSLDFSREEHWSGLPFPSLGDLPKPGVKPGSPVTASRFFFFFNRLSHHLLQSHEHKSAALSLLLINIYLFISGRLKSDDPGGSLS